jgi:acetate kinase
MPEEIEYASGEAVRVGTRTTTQSAIIHSVHGKKHTLNVPLPDHSAAFRAVISLLTHDMQLYPELAYKYFAHRYVHPGTQFSKTTFLDEKTIDRLKSAVSLAPIHNTISLELIEMCSREYQNIPQYAVFDTVFHRTIPQELSSYALPEELVKKYHLRRIGFHGISHRFIMEESCRFLNRDPVTQKIISFHLGSGGSSVCAMRNGKSINNSMGFTPLEGLMMNTRCGDLDIGVLLQVMEKNHFTAEDMEKVLNYKSGILGVFSSSSDMRDVVSRLNDDKKAQIVFAMYVRRVRKYLGYYTLLLKKADILVFTDTLGIELPLLRERICEGLDCFGIRLDVTKNNVTDYRNTDLTKEGSQTRILAIPTNEEIMIARETFEEVHNDHRC